MPADRRHRSVLDTNARLGRWGVGTVTIQRAEDLPAGGDLQADVCIVGSGAAGITLARQLDGSRLRVVMLEAGGWSAPRPPRPTTSPCTTSAVRAATTSTPGVAGTEAARTSGSVASRCRTGSTSSGDRGCRTAGGRCPTTNWRRGSVSPPSILDVPRFDMIDIERWPPNPTIETFRGAAELGVFLWADGMFMGRHARALVEASRNVRLVLDATVTELVAGERVDRVAGRRRARRATLHASPPRRSSSPPAAWRTRA